jgi:hypothetical protein
MKLPFLDRGCDHGPVRDFWCLRDHDIPQRPGAYILLARPRITFMYPRRRSSVFYIGKAANLRARLRQHLRYATEARCDRQETLYWHRYEYAAAFGGRYTYVLAKPRQKPKCLEDDLLAMFAEHYRSWPAANGVGSWNSLLTPAQLRRRRAGG